MVEFEKNIDELLPYSRAQYRAYFNEDDDTFDRNVVWYAVSLQQGEIRNKNYIRLQNRL
jgi:hypothetical protein